MKTLQERQTFFAGLNLHGILMGYEPFYTIPMSIGNFRLDRTPFFPAYVLKKINEKTIWQVACENGNCDKI